MTSNNNSGSKTGQGTKPSDFFQDHISRLSVPVPPAPKPPTPK